MRPRSTPPGDHRPVMLDEVLAALDPKPGELAVDCTVGGAGHAVELLKRVGPTGRLIGFDLDADNLPPARERLSAVGAPFELRHGNFAGLAAVLAAEGVRADVLVADLGMSSMQVDDPGRGFSFVRDGPLDMRMDRSRGRSAADMLATLPAHDLATAFRELANEPEADRIAAAIVEARRGQPIATTAELARLVERAAPVKIEPKRKGVPTPRQQRLRPAARVFQALRILVNRELANLQELLRVLPDCLAPGGRAAVVSFHSGEDRLVKVALRDGERRGDYERVSDEPVRPSFAERTANPRARSAKLRQARRAP
jgi:16S rRNA (cytosine1402-N4)-methyltransferase